jgi:Fe2+ or Zn2+ uptake regulation protein
MELPGEFLDYLIDRAEKVRASQRARSTRQMTKVREALLTNPDRAAASETLRALQADVERFGVKQVFPADDEPEPDAG